MDNNGMVLFEGDLYLLTREEGGRQTPVKSGAFRTDVRFKEGARFCSISFDDDYLHPGDTKRVFIEILLHNDEEIDYLLSLDEWLLFDGPAHIAKVTNFKISPESD